jgi:hypothetical protein
VAASKRDALGEVDPLPALEAEARRLGLRLFPISAVSGQGLRDLNRALLALVDEARQPAAEKTGEPA